MLPLVVCDLLRWIRTSNKSHSDLITALATFAAANMPVL